VLPSTSEQMYPLILKNKFIVMVEGNSDVSVSAENYLKI